MRANIGVTMVTAILAKNMISVPDEPGPRGSAGRDLRTRPLRDVTPYRLLIADDHPLFRGALRQAILGLFVAADIAEAGSFDEVRV